MRELSGTIQFKMAAWGYPIGKNLVVTKSTRHPELWAITHLETGRTLGERITFYKLKNAKAAAESVADSPAWGNLGTFNDHDSHCVTSAEIKSTISEEEYTRIRKTLMAAVADDRDTVDIIDDDDN